MPDDHNDDHDDPKRAERGIRPPEQTGTNVGLLSPGTQTEYDPGFADEARYGAAGAPSPPPEYPGSLLGDPVLYEHGNEPVRISVFQSAQHNFGNKAVQRHMGSLPVQRDNTGLPPVPSVALTPPSILQPDNPAARYGLGDQFRFRIDPRTEIMMRQYMNLQFDSTLPTVQSAGTGFQSSGPPAGTGQQPPPGGGAAPPAGGGGGQGASPPPATPSASPPAGGGSGAPSQPGAGPSSPQPASAGQIVSAALASEPFKTAWTNLQTSMTNQAASDWRRLRLGEKVVLITTGASIALGGLAGVTLTNDPSARQLLLGQLNGQTIPVPGVSWLRVEMNTSGEALMFGLHGDVGALLGPRFGFKASGASPIGGPPQPQSYAPPPPIQRVIQRMVAWHGFGMSESVVDVQRTVAVQRDDAAPVAPKAKQGSYTTTFKSTNETWAVSGTTLAEAVADIESRDEAGETSWTPSFAVDLDDDGTVRGATVEITINVVMPDWPGAANLNAKDKKKWKTFMQALRAHEDGHIKMAKAKLKNIAKKMKKKTEAEAGEALDTALAELKEASDAYDEKNDHGRKAGTVIEVDEEAKAQTAPVQPLKMGASFVGVTGSRAAAAEVGVGLPVQRDNKGPAAAPAGGKVNFKPTVNTTYTVTAKTLKEASAQIKKREEAGETSWNPVFTETHDDNGNITSATVDVTVTVLLPTWAEAAKLKGTETTTWDNFMTALRAHEQHHVDLVKEKLKGVADQMIGKSKTEATGLLRKALEGLKTASDEYDTKTDHGKNEGVNIDTADEAPPAKEAEESAPKGEGEYEYGPTLSLMRAEGAVNVQRTHENMYVQRFLSGERVAGVIVQRAPTPAPAPPTPLTKNFGEVEAVLKQSSTGTDALILMKILNVRVVLKAGVKMGYDPSTNLIELDANVSPVALALAFAHEMNHARMAKETVTSMERAKKLSLDEFLKEMLKEEAESDIKAYDVKYELQGAELDFTKALPPGKVITEELYRTTIMTKAMEAQIADSTRSGKQLLDIGKVAGKAAVIDHFQNKPGHESHRTHYTAQWKAANPGK
ncbi:MAG: DUF922 domain-containing protein [Chloroflexia bacterium]